MKLEIEYLPVNALKPYDRNTRKHGKLDVGKIAESIRKYGFDDPIGIWGADNLIVEGHGRLMAAQELGMQEVPCVRLDHLSDVERREYAIVHNKSAELSAWDFETLKMEIPELDLSAFDFQWDMDSDTDAKDDDFDVDDAVPETPVSQQGDIWMLGRHRLICGDSTKADTYKSLMDGRKANLVVTDPPYNVNYEGSAGKIKNDNMDNDSFFDFLFDAFSCMHDAMTDDASIYVFHADTEGLNFRKAFDAAGFYLSGCCIWKKPSLVLGRSPYQWQHEPCLYGWKKKGKHQWYSGRKETTIWEFEKPKKNADHPTMKPIPLLAYPIENSTQQNAIVLDPFGGSGSTLIACQQTNRICFTIELDEKFCDVIVKRHIEQAGGSDDVCLIRGGHSMPYAQIPGIN